MRFTSLITDKANPALINLGFKVFGFGVAFLASAYSAQSYGPTLFGFVILSIFAQYILCEITDLGFSTHLARQIAQTNSPFRTWLNHIPRILFRSLLAMGIWIIGIKLSTDRNLPIDFILVLNIPFWLCNSYFQQVAYAKGELTLANMEVFLQNALLVAIFPLSLFTSQFYEKGVVLSSFLSFLFSLTASIFKNNRDGAMGARRLPKFDLKILHNDGIRLASSRILGIATYLDTLAMGILFGPAIAGFYALASRMRAVLPAGLISISDSTYSRAISTRQLSLIFGSLENKIITGFTLGISGLLFIYTTPLILRIYGPAYSQSAVYFRFFIIISFAIGLVYILRNLLIAWNQDNYIRKHVYLFIIIQLNLSLALYFILQNYAIPVALLLSNLFLIFAFGKKVHSIRVLR
jgi:hypothetical protein